MFFLLLYYFSDYSVFQIIPQNSIKWGIRLGIIELLMLKRGGKVFMLHNKCSRNIGTGILILQKSVLESQKPGLIEIYTSL